MNMSNMNIWPFKRSDHDQFESLVRPHLKQLYKLAYRFCGQRDDAEDLVQDVLLKLFPRLQQMQQIEKLGPWMARILYRQFIDTLRSQQRSPLQLVEDEQGLYQAHADSSPTPAEELSAVQHIHHLQQAIDQLNEDQRLLVILHDVEGYSLPEIQQIMDVPLGTLKSRLNRARNKMRELLTAMEPFDGHQRVNQVTG